MAVGDIHIPQMQAVKGLKIGSTQAYVRYPNRRDLVIFEFSEGTHVAGIFTQNAFCAAPVHVCEKHLNIENSRYLIINTGNANAGTGAEGMKNAYAMCEAVAKETGVKTEQVLPFSTGVIGEQLPIDRITQAVKPALDTLNQNAWLDAAHGIMTTDTIPKGASTQIELDGIIYNMTGISKGAGMIRPNMATMLSFVVTDIPISKTLVQQLLKESADQSFNRITVDGDTSTNDSCIFAATGQGGGQEIQTEQDPRYVLVKEKLFEIMKRLAHLIVRDGEGATKFITVDVKGGKTTQECCDVAYSIAHSPLVKTALFASDPNWGRILCAIGYANITELDVEKVQVWLDEVQICENGGRAHRYTEEEGVRVMSKPELTIHVDLGRGDAQDIVYTCDLSYDYVKINADYRS